MGLDGSEFSYCFLNLNSNCSKFFEVWGFGVVAREVWMGCSVSNLQIIASLNT